MKSSEARLTVDKGQAFTFLGCKLSGDLRGQMFEACVEQRFHNPGEKNLEVVYTFPLPWGAVLLGVEVVLGDKHLSGLVVEKVQAEAEYEEALSEGNAAIMLEKNADHSYSLNLGNLAPGEDCLITLRYAQVLSFEQGGLRLLIPTTIAPRYGRTGGSTGLKPHQAPESSVTADHLFSLEIRVHGELTKARIASPSHNIGMAISSAESGNIIKLSLTRRSSMDRDFVLVIDQVAHDSLAVCAQDPIEPGVVVLAGFRPRLQAQAPLAAKVKLLVDCSGSMAGDSIEAAKRALQSIVQQMNTGDRFSLSRFGSTVEHRSRGLWKLTEITRQAAQRWVSELGADLGGTEMEAALNSTFALEKTLCSDVLLVTDGEINAIDSTIESAKQSGHRLFVVGIGSSPAEAHLRRLAEATGGACDFVAPGEAVEPAVLRMFTRLRSPRLTDIRLSCSDGMMTQWVSPLPGSVFDGDTVNVFARLPALPEGELHLTGNRPEDGAIQEIGAIRAEPARESAATLARLAAAIRCQSASTEAREITTQRAVAYQLVTEQTNFLLVHERAEADKATDMPELAKVDPMLAAGWGGLGSVRVGKASLKTALAELAFSASSSVLGSMKYCKTPSICDYDIPAYWRKPRGDADKNRRTPPDPCHWIKTADYVGLTPLGLAEWLHTQDRSLWPENYADLRRIGLGNALVDWLELLVAAQNTPPWSTLEVVGTFLYLMSRQETRDALSRSEGILANFKALFHRPKAQASLTEAKNINLKLLETMSVLLEGMTATDWPDQVFAMSPVGDEHGEASIISGALC